MGDTLKPGCQHYERNCSLLAPCCNKVYKCRVCHDEEEMHTLDRKCVEKVVCNKCDLTSPVCETCPGCDTVFGTAYFCKICRLYDNVDKKQFHCDGCGICRLGGSDNFVHCYTCEMCMPKNQPHKCIEKSSHSNCPVCFESIHSARVTTHIPKCGHLIHSPCYEEMFKKGLYACPTCGKSMGNMTHVWNHLDRDIEMTPMPTEYQGLYREILCKDCSTVSTVKFHVVGMKCSKSSCGSFNTSIEGPFVKKDESGEFVGLTEAELAELFSVSLPGAQPTSQEDDSNNEDIDEDIDDDLDGDIVDVLGDEEPVDLEDLFTALHSSDSNWETESETDDDDQNKDNDENIDER